MTTPTQWLRVAAKLVVLGITASLLLATSPVPPEPLCSQRAAPVAFQAVGTCGPGGLIVVEANQARGEVSVANAAALGLPPLAPPLGARGMYRGEACPFTLVRGEWDLEWQDCGTPAGADAATDGGAQGGSDAAGPGTGESTACLQRCSADLAADGQLLFTCRAATGALLCQSRLSTVISP